MNTEVTVTAARDLAGLAADIMREHDAARAAATSALCHARRAGELLLEAKDQVGHGNWSDWLTANFPASARTARLYMQVARRWEEVDPGENGNALPIRQAARLLAEPTEHAELDDFEARIEKLVPELFVSEDHITVGQAGRWEIWIEPSDRDGYFYSTIMRKKDGEENFEAVGTLRPVSPFGIAIQAALEDGFPLAELAWQTVPCVTRSSFNRWLFTSHEDYMQRHVLAGAKS